MRNLAPIVLFVFNRADHASQTLEALKKNNLAKDSELFIFCDGQRNELEAEKVKEVYKIIDNVSGFKNVTVIKSDKNKGLANSIIDGVSEIVKKFGKVIVIEDDLVTSPFFLEFLNDGLDFYQNDERVISIHGYCYPIKNELPSTFFLKGADCWGWATWKRGWDLFERDGKKLLAQLKEKKLTEIFDFDGTYKYTKMLEDQIAGKNNSWAIRWNASAFLANKFTLYPGKTLVKNIGFDDSGTHSGSSDEHGQEVYDKRIIIDKITVEENPKIRKLIKNYFKPKKNIFSKIIAKIKKKINKRKLRKERKKYGWFTTNLSWDELNEISKGYSGREILDKCIDSLLKVKNNQSLHERDSVVFKEEQTPQSLVDMILDASKNHHEINIVDFGGSLGSSYYQCKNFLKNKKLKWNIIEQENFVIAGKKYFEDENLKFYYDIESCLKENPADILLLSSVVQYLPKPYEFLADLMNYNFNNIIVARTNFLDKDILTLQKVPPEIYSASYPCWFFNKENFLKAFQDKYQLVSEFDSEFDLNIVIDRTIKADSKGFYFKLKTNEK